MKTFLKLLLAGALAGLLFTTGDAAPSAFTNLIVGALIAWTLVQYRPTRSRWQPKLRLMTAGPTARRHHSLGCNPRNVGSIARKG